MTQRLRLAVTADLHWGIRPRGDEATRLLVAFLEAEPPDVLVLAGDVTGTPPINSTSSASIRSPCA